MEPGPAGDRANSATNESSADQELVAGQPLDPAAEWTSAEFAAWPPPADPLVSPAFQDALRRLQLFQEGQNLRRRGEADVQLALAAGAAGDTERAMSYLRRGFRMMLAAGRSLDNASAGLVDPEGQPLVDAAPEQVADLLYYYRCGLLQALACCRVRIWERYGEPPVVVATELPDNPGMSITNAAAQLAADVWDLLGCPERGLTWIEHYPQQGPEPHERESFAAVSFTWTGGSFSEPQWRHLTQEAVEALIGGPLEEGRAE